MKLKKRSGGPARLLWLYSAIMMALWGILGCGVSTWPAFAAIYLFLSFRLPAPSWPEESDTFLTSPRTWTAFAAFAAVSSTVIPVLERV